MFLSDLINSINIFLHTLIATKKSATSIDILAFASISFSFNFSISIALGFAVSQQHFACPN